MTVILDLLVAKIKKKFTTKIPTFIYVPAACPNCGALIDIPMSKSPMIVTCFLCNTVCYSMAIGIVDTNEHRLEYVYNEIAKQVRVASSSYKEASKTSVH